MRSVILVTFAVTCLVLTLVGLPGDSFAQGTKSQNLPGYSFEHVTDNSNTDRLPRVSRNGLIVWSSSGGLPGSTSGTSDLEIFYWDGVETLQITDNDVDDRRAVVNNMGTIAWMDAFGGEEGEVYVRRNGITSQLTSDPLPGVRDRYPDLNDNDVVVWPRELSDGWHVMVHDLRVGPGFTDAGRGYRPHLNNLDHISAASVYNLTDLQGRPLVVLPRHWQLGYALYRRGELNDSDQMILEADLDPDIDPDYTGARDLLFWDGTQMIVLAQSDEWLGRADLNSDGVVAWEAFGGLPGSQSGKADREIFVYRPDSGVTLQITDDDADDIWPTVADDGTIVWEGEGVYPGAVFSASDHEIFRAIPLGNDLDGDGIIDAIDNCPTEPNFDQANNTQDPDLDRGDACQCGDVTGGGIVDATDLDSLRLALASGIALQTLRTCGLNDPELSCSVVDAAVLARALSTPATASVSLSSCPATEPLL